MMQWKYWRFFIFFKIQELGSQKLDYLFFRIFWFHWYLFHSSTSKTDWDLGIRKRFCNYCVPSLSRFLFGNQFFHEWQIIIFKIFISVPNFKCVDFIAKRLQKWCLILLKVFNRNFNDKAFLVYLRSILLKRSIYIFW